MKKRIIALTVCLVLIAAALAGCGPKEAKATFTNDSAWTFNEIYLSPTASDDWGEDQLGGTNILKAGGSCEVTLESTGNGLYDIEALDEEGDLWTFMRIPLEAGSEVIILHTGAEVLAVSVSPEGEETEIVGELSSDASSEEGWFEFMLYNDTGYAFMEVYVTGIDADDKGYNHVADAPQQDGSYATIGLEEQSSYIIAIIDEDGDGWVFADVYLEQSCEVNISFSDPEMTVYYMDGSTQTYVCEFESDPAW